jgi:hypothetical protein
MILPGTIGNLTCIEKMFFPICRATALRRCTAMPHKDCVPSVECHYCGETLGLFRRIIRSSYCCIEHARLGHACETELNRMIAEARVAQHTGQESLLNLATATGTSEAAGLQATGESVIAEAHPDIAANGKQARNT